MRHAAWIVATVCCVGCVGGSTPTPSPSPSPYELPAEERDEVAETTLRHEVRMARQLPGYSSVCISLWGADPPPAFLDRFTGLTPKAVPLSTCQDVVDLQLVDATGGPAAVLRVHEVVKASPREVVVRASWSPGRTVAGGAGFEFTLRRVIGVWSVVDAKNLWVE